MEKFLDPIINTLTGNVTRNDELVDQVLAKIAELKIAKKNAEDAATGDNASNAESISNLNKQIQSLNGELQTYKKNLDAANDALKATLVKMETVVNEPTVAAVDTAVGGTDADATASAAVGGTADGKRRKNRKSKSKKTKKTKRSRKSKKRQH